MQQLILHHRRNTLTSSMRVQSMDLRNGVLLIELKVSIYTLSIIRMIRMYVLPSSNLSLLPSKYLEYMFAAKSFMNFFIVFIYF